MQFAHLVDFFILNYRAMPGDANPQEGGLFQGIRFWLSQKIPQRSRFINDVRVRHPFNTKRRRP